MYLVTVKLLSPGDLSAIVPGFYTFIKLCIFYFFTETWVENGWLCIRSIQIITKPTALMRNHPFSTLPVAISRQCCIDNQNVHNTNSHMCLSCVRDDILNI